MPQIFAGGRTSLTPSSSQGAVIHTIPCWISLVPSSYLALLDIIGLELIPCHVRYHCCLVNTLQCWNLAMLDIIGL